MIIKAARRYASALMQIGKEQDNVEAISEDIELIRNTIDDSRELQLFLRSPIIKYDVKIQALEELFGDKVQKITNQFIKLLARKDRVGILHDITEAYTEEYNRYAGIIKVEVFAAQPLSDQQQKSLHKALEQKTGKTVNMNVSVNESLKGGIAVRIDDTVIDGTIKRKLEQLEEQFLSTAAE